MKRIINMENNKYVSHEITKKMFENNEDFYDAVVRKNFDIRSFGSHSARGSGARDRSSVFSRLVG